ncbi:MAG: transglycosylase domain-containing protein [Saprospiraceae bacterium]|uniref:transglycosylase domain-containing protein n=1 Tax=Candidatus Brachybacter algidus TaxID=2982024 RepID=UPI00257E0D32|nr:transglycosylase domain-containing protein [Candidatus Brachybacter algidus]MBK7603893.1 transglycosylase domain-containing protein [Candidatus Brachybacter algidus]
MSENTFISKVKTVLSVIKSKIAIANANLKKRPVANVIVKGLLGIFLTIFGGIFLLIMAARIGVFGGMPSNSELRSISNPEGTELIADDGKTLIGRYFIENRTNTTFDSLPSNLIHALISTEDIRYYEHNGIDWKSWARVLWRTILLKESSSGGGSTISQQLAKNLFKRRSYWRGTTLINKVREIVIAQRLENMYSKEELLTLYFNTVSFGGNVFGIDVAAKQYFSCSTKNLKTEDAATLVGMLKATTKYNPLNNLDLAKKRRNTVLNKMERYGYLTKPQADSISELPIKLNYVKETHNIGIATYFREYARIDLDNALGHLKKSDGSNYNLYTDGLKVYTSINLSMQDFAEKAVAEQMEELQDLYTQQMRWIKLPWKDTSFLNKVILNTERYKSMSAAGKTHSYIDSVFNVPMDMTVYSQKGDKKMKMSPKDSLIYYLQFLSTGFMAADPTTGFIKAWVGGIDNTYFQYDHVKARRHVGSTFKPIVYSAALEKGLNPCDYYDNTQKTYPQFDNWSPRNFEGGYGGEYSMAGALAKSLNCATVDIMLKTGIDTVVDFAKKIGITSTIPSEPSVSLGAVDISLLDMMTAYSVFMNRGLRPKMTYIMKVVDSEGNILIDNTTEKSQEKELVMNPENADMMRNMMQGVINHGTGGSVKWKYQVTEDLAGKTGTSQDCSDGWFIASNPKLIAGAWVGGEFPEIHLQGNFTGAFTALPIVGKFLHQVEKDKSLKDYVSSKFPEISKEAKEKLSCAYSRYTFDPNAADSTSLDSLGNPIEPVMDEDAPEDDGSSKKDSTKKKNIFSRIFDGKKDDKKKKDSEQE